MRKMFIIPLSLLTYLWISCSSGSTESEMMMLIRDPFYLCDPELSCVPPEGGSCKIHWQGQCNNIYGLVEIEASLEESIDIEFDEQGQIIKPYWAEVIKLGKGMSLPVVWTGDSVQGEWFTIIKKNFGDFQDYHVTSRGVRCVAEMQIELEPNTTGHGRILKIDIDPSEFRSAFVFQETQEGSEEVKD